MRPTIERDIHGCIDPYTGKFLDDTGYVRVDFVITQNCTGLFGSSQSKRFMKWFEGQVIPSRRFVKEEDGKYVFYYGGPDRLAFIDKQFVDTIVV